MGLQRSPERPLEVDALGATLRFFCSSETVAVPLFKELRSQCIAPVARAALGRILVDEVRHRQFGWDTLEYFVDVLPSARKLAADLLPGFMQQLRRAYGPAEAAEAAAAVAVSAAIGPTERAWGLMPPAEYARILERTVYKEYMPRSTALGIELRETS